MRSGNSRGALIALGLACALAFATTCRADLFHVIPDLVPAVDVNTGGPYMAPPIPAGHYTGKNFSGHIKKKLGMMHGLCGACGGAGCGACGGGMGGGLLHHGNGAGGGPCGMGDPCGGAPGCNLGHGQSHGGLFQKCGGLGCGGSICGNQGCGTGLCGPVCPTAQSAPVIPSAQCAAPGCSLGGRHRHKGCGLCGGNGCNRCGIVDPCNSCGGKGCGLCGGMGKGCGLCGGKGCGACGMGKGCGICGGRGCGACSKIHGIVNHLLCRDKIKWFVGPGGPVPLTPGYTPYIVTTRSPRDFLAFPPFTP